MDPEQWTGTMGDSDSGSSSAAQGAQDQAGDGRRGLMGRVFGAFALGNGRTPGVHENPHPMNGAPSAAALPDIVNLLRLRVEDVAVPKADIIAVSINTGKDQVLRTFRESGLTRLPVYEGTLDSPKGLVHLKDFALNHGFNGTGGRFVLRKMLRPLLFAPPSMPIGVLLKKMQSERMHLALVIDEYGGVDGLVSIEDLIEQVLGEIEDEHDVEEDDFWALEKPGCYLVQAKAPLAEFESEIGLSLRLAEQKDSEEIDTLGGLLFMLSRGVPARGEVIRHPQGAEFEVVDADPRRIKKLRVRVPSPHDG